LLRLFRVTDLGKEIIFELRGKTSKRKNLDENRIKKSILKKL